MGLSHDAVMSVQNMMMPGERIHVLMEQLTRFSVYDERRPALTAASIR